MQEQKNGPGFSSSSWEEILIPVRKEEEKKYLQSLLHTAVLFVDQFLAAESN